MEINLLEIIATFMVMFAIIDIPGSIPVILSIKKKTGSIEPLKAILVVFGIFVLFLFAGNILLRLFGIDVSSFAIAGSFIILLAIAIRLFLNNTGIVLTDGR